MMYTMNMKPMSRTCRMPMPGLMADPFFRSMMGMEPASRPQGMRVDVRETEESYILEAELPGVALEDITLTTEDDVLTIAADVNIRNDEEREGYVMHERRSGHLERRFSLEGICQEGITADSRNGILTVVLPKVKPEGAKALRRIAIGGAPVEAPALPEGETIPEA